jgi:phosphodiesterase/alkaline phosphatase D-like protein
MDITHRIAHQVRHTTLLVAVAVLAAATFTTAAEAALTFTGVAAGDASSTKITLWTRAMDPAAPGNAVLSVDLATNSSFAGSIMHVAPACTTDSTKDFTCKVDIGNLQPNTIYFYRFVGPASELSNTGRFKTSPASSTKAPLHFAFSGDNDGLMRPFALATQLPAQNLDFYVNLGDVIYETASNLTTTGSHNGQPWLNSPAATVTGSSATLNGIPTSGPNFATQVQLKSDYERKYRENFLPVNPGGQNSLQVLYASQGNYTLYDNHELGNRQYINGGAPAGGSVGGTGNDMPTGRGVDARSLGTGNPANANDVNTSSSDYMNRSIGFLTLRDVFLSYQPISPNRPVVNAPLDPRTDLSKQLYSAQQWGTNAIYIHTDTRSYRDLRLKSADGSVDDTGARADNPGRTMFGATQLAWLKQTLLGAEAAGTVWKFVSVSDPIDQIGPLGGSLTLLNLPNFGPGGYAPVNADGGKSFIGGYRAERNDLLKFIADNHITNVVFLATDDHQNRINELTYSPTGQTNVQSSYVKVPYTFSIVAGPLGATGPDLITNHTFTMAQQYANSIVAAETAAGVEPIGLESYPGLHNLVRDGDPLADVAPQPVDFYSPDTFNFTILDVSADGLTLSVKSFGMNSTTVNTGIEYANGPQAHTILSFDLDAAPTLAGLQINDGSAQRSKVRSVTVTLNGVLAQSSIGAGAFVLTSTGGQFSTTVQSVSVEDRQTFITLGFTGPGVGPDGSLPDGSYTLSMDRSKIPVDTSNPITTIGSFQTLFGDLDGDGRVNGPEVAASAHLNGTHRGDPDYLWYLDFNADGVIDGKDHREVARRNGG